MKKYAAFSPSKRMILFCKLFAFTLIVSIFVFVVDVNAQKIRLRGKLDPLVGTYAYSDLWAEGNVAVLGTYCKNTLGCTSADMQGALIFDISNPDNPVLASLYQPTPNQQFLEALVKNNIGYFGSGNGGGVYVVNLSNPYQPVLMTTINSTNGGGYNTIHEILIDGNFLYETDSRTKVIKVINIANLTAPEFVRNITTTDPSFIHAVHIAGGRLFCSGWGGTTEIYDISNVGTQQPPLIGVINSGSNSHSSWTTEDGNYLYNARELFNGDLRVYDIRNAANPVLVKSINAATLGINAICPHNPVVKGNLLYVSWYQAGLQVFDITNPADPKPIAQFDTFPNAFVPADEMLGSEPLDIYCGYADLRANGAALGLIPSNYGGNWSVFPFLGEDKVILGDLAEGFYIVDVSNVRNPLKNRVADFDGDLKTDISQFRPSNGAWYIENSSNSSNLAYVWGVSTDLRAPADYDGDGKTDIAVYRPSNGTWYVAKSTGGFDIAQFGLPGDIPVPGDYDSDGKADYAVFRNGIWYIQQSKLGFRANAWGAAGDKPQVGDFDFDGKTDLAVWRQSTGIWYILPSTTSIMRAVQFGVSTDIPVVGDYDGDSYSDVAVYRPSTGVWYVLRTANNSFYAVQFGQNADIPTPGDFDGDAKTDFAVFRPSGSVWYVLNSSNNSVRVKVYGASEDLPAPASFGQ
jgi:hypothetical protein